MSNLYEQPQQELDPVLIQKCTEIMSSQSYYLSYDVAVLTEQGQQIVRELYGPMPLITNIQQANEFVTWVQTEGLQHCEAQARRIHDSRFMEISPKIFLATCNDAFSGLTG